MRMLLALLVFSVAVCARSETFRCSKCQHEVLKGDTFCSNCGADFKAPVRVTQSLEQSLVQSLLEPKSVPQPVRPEPRSQPSYESRVENGGNTVQTRNEYAVHAELSWSDCLSGMGRGLLTALFSPMSVFRGMGWGCGVVQEGLNKGQDPNNPTTAFLGMMMVYPGAAMGLFGTCADIINGTLDMVTLGSYGEWLYRPEGAHPPTPWFWERDWYDVGEWPAFPWITK